MNSIREHPAGVRRATPSFSWHGWAGLLLIAVFWPLNWLLPGLRTHVLFFPLWLGYVLVVDALTLRRSGTSLLTRSPRDFTLLFLISEPAWWLFEVLNWRAQNWRYLARDQFSDLEYVVYASLCFSIVMPAVFGTAELIRTFGWIDRFVHRSPVHVTRRVCVVFLAIGSVMLVALLTWPRYFFPFMWMSLFFFLEPVCVWLGRRSILSGLARGDWRTVVALCTAGLVCGFFWELWNIFSYPKWVYDIPFFGFWHVFEMPLLGYLGYLPFALELYVLVHLFSWRAPQLRI